VIYGDDAGNPEEAVNVAKRLISRDEVLISIGGISSSMLRNSRDLEFRCDPAPTQDEDNFGRHILTISPNHRAPILEARDGRMARQPDPAQGPAPR
jgi:hypothetical protein